jgi:hypothetical protein
MARFYGKHLRRGGIPRSANFGLPVAELFIVGTMSLVPLVLLVWFVRYLIEMSRERRRLRIEVSKLAHELETLRAGRGDREALKGTSS